MTGTTRAIQDQDTGRGLVTAREVADLLGVPTSWVYEQSRRGRIPTVTLGRYRRYRLEAIEAWSDHATCRAPRERRESAWLRGAALTANVGTGGMGNRRAG